MTGIDIALIAVGAATAAFTGYAIFQRWLERDRPRWRVDAVHGTAQPFTDGKVAFLVRFTNVGTGPALDVRVAPTYGGDASDRVESGESFTAHVSCDWGLPVPEPGGWGIRGFATVLEAIPEEASFMLTWHQPPVLWRTRKRRFQLRHVLASVLPRSDEPASGPAV